MNPLKYSAILPVVLILASCGGSKASPATSSQTQTPTVEVVKVISQPLNTTLRLPGELKPYESVALLPKVPGFIDKIFVDRGSKVKSGQLLAQLVAPELASQRAEAESKVKFAEAKIAAARSKLALDQSTFERLQSASKTPGVVAGNDLISSQKTMEADQEQVNAATANADAARQALQVAAQGEKYLRITAPFDGVITERTVHPGALVSPNQSTPILRIENVKRLRLVVPVPESATSAVSEHAKVEFTVSSYPTKKFQGTVARNSHAVDPKTRTMPVELDVDNSDRRLNSGAFSEVIWPVKRENSIFVPATAIANNLERTFVIRITNGKTEWVDVKQGNPVGLLVEVTGDLKAGDEVAFRATDETKPGSQVSVRLAETPRDLH